MPGRMDPNIEFAAQAGDPAAMGMLGRYLHWCALARHYWDKRDGDLDRFLNERHDNLARSREWLLAAAEAGDPEAMYDLSQFRSDLLGAEHPVSDPDRRAELAAYWLRRSAEAGWVAAMESMSKDVTSPDEQEFWLRRAAEGGARMSMFHLAERLERDGRVAEAEHWYRAAVQNGLRFARRSLAALLMKQDRLIEAEQWVRPQAQASDWKAAATLAEILERQAAVQLEGRFERRPDAPAEIWELPTKPREEAEQWRAESERLRKQPVPSPMRASPLAEVAITAVVTTAIVPFLQALTAKVAEDAYGQARQMVRRLLRRNARNNETTEQSQHSTPSADVEPGLAIIQDPDEDITLFLWSNASDEALRALSVLDQRELTLRRPDQGQVHLVWHPASGRWHIRGS